MFVFKQIQKIKIINEELTKDLLRNKRKLENQLGMVHSLDLLSYYKCSCVFQKLWNFLILNNELKFATIDIHNIIFLNLNLLS